ncbi:hypothetical protein APHAL10511_007872 [Amanita phalloides]|nr:hypothetical protein APHAL10511_007872 [Amanita phalloides]
MAASKSRKPYQTSLQLSPDTRIKSSIRRGTQKGKEKESTICANAKKRDASSSSARRKPSVAWNWTTLTDPSASRTPPIYTKDGSYFFSLVGSSIRIYSVATGQVVSTLSAPQSINPASESSFLTSAVLNPWNAFQLITGSLDGRLMIWDFLDATLLHTIDVAQPIHRICAHEKFKNSVFVVAAKSYEKRHSDDALVLQVSLSSDQSQHSARKSVIAVIGKTRFPSGLAFSPTGTWLVATAGHKVYVATSSSLKSGFVKYVSPERLTCMAFHPFEDYFATGDEKGVIRLWYCLNDNLAINVKGVEKHTQTTSFHWHAHAVSSLAFTSNGAYLLSGGEEAVLVIWQIHSGKREFVPRLGAPISTVSISKGLGEESYLVGLVDATYSFISPGSLRISRSYSGIKLGPTHAMTTCKSFSPIAVHGNSSTVILPSSHPSSLQIYLPSSSKMLYELEVTPSNRVSRRDEKPIESPQVDKVTVSNSGQWMATVDIREEDETFHGEIYLKLWLWNHKSDYWILNTRIDRPHGLKRITDLTFSSSSHPYLATTGEDGQVKIWAVHIVKDRTGEQEYFWTTRSTFSVRSELPNSASWSFDSSLLAVSLGPYVAIYDPESNALRETISPFECPAIKAVRFIGRGGRYIAIAGAQELVLWDLILQSARWLYRTPMPIQQVISHDHEDTFAAFHVCSTTDINKTMALIFNVASPSPMDKQIIPYVFRAIVAYTPSQMRANFIGITSSWAVVSFGEIALRSHVEGSSGNKIPAEAINHKRTLFQDIFGVSAFEHVVSEQPNWSSPSTAVVPRSKAPVAAFDNASHLLQPMSSVFDTIMQELVHVQPLASTNAVQEIDADEDIDMELDVPEVVASQNQKARDIGQEEIQGLIDLFKSHTVGFKYLTPTANTNGKVCIQPKTIVNGNARHLPFASPVPKTNGSLPQKQNVTKPPLPVVTPKSTPSPTPPENASHQSKKRKKPSG